jgi:hypothetical protein
VKKRVMDDFPELVRWDGDVEGVLRGDETELLRELLAVVDATRDRSIKLTKSGIPPKPLWSAVNERIIWQDPRSILYDWDEVDQVRFVYSIAMALGLVQPDEERLLVVGPGADQFYLSAPTRRADMLLRAYVSIEEWDERCDARNNEGHRHNFGQTFRRDFKRSASEMRGELVKALAATPPEAWFTADSLAIVLTWQAPDLLVSEDDESVPPVDHVADPEIVRLLDYWLFLVARLGLVDLARCAEGTAMEGERVYRVTPLGVRVLRGHAWDGEADEIAAIAAQRPLFVQPNNEIVLYRPEGDVGDEYVLHRIAEDPGVPNWEDSVVTYRVNRATMSSAIESGLDPALIRDRIVTRSRTDVPSTFATQLADAERNLGSARLVPGYTAVELPVEPAPGLAPALRSAGFEVFGRLVLVPWRRWGEFVVIAGGEPRESFRYPNEEPLIEFDGDDAELLFLAQPLAARDLLDALGLDGSEQVTIDDAALARLATRGWSPRAVAEALLPLVESLPRRLKSELK